MCDRLADLSSGACPNAEIFVRATDISDRHGDSGERQILFWVTEPLLCPSIHRDPQRGRFGRVGIQADFTHTALELAQQPLHGQRFHHRLMGHCIEGFSHIHETNTVDDAWPYSHQ